MKYEQKATLACVNFGGEWGNKAARFQKMKTIVQETAKQGADIIVFPEMALTGYDCDEEGTRLRKPCRMHAELAETVPGPSTNEMAKLAKELGVYVIFGLPERDKTNPKQPPYNAAAIIGPEGILGTYRKLHLVPPPRFRESICFTPGNEIPVWETKFGLIGVAICFDFNFNPDLVRVMALKGARLIVNPMGSPATPGKREFLVQQCGARATENLIYAASANVTGMERVTRFHGNSTIAGPNNTRFISILAEASEMEEVISATLNFDLIDYISSVTIKWKEMHRIEVIAKEFNKLAKAAK